MIAFDTDFVSLITRGIPWAVEKAQEFPCVINGFRQL